MERIKNFFNDESGAAAVEYGLLVGLIAVVIVVAVTASGYADLNATFTSCYVSTACPNLFGPGVNGAAPCRASAFQELENRTGNSKISGPVFSETGQVSPHDRISPGAGSGWHGWGFGEREAFFTFLDDS